MVIFEYLTALETSVSSALCCYGVSFLCQSTMSVPVSVHDAPMWAMAIHSIKNKKRLHSDYLI